MSKFEDLIKSYKNRVDIALDKLLPRSNYSRLTDAMRYSVLNSGKRLRPILVYLSSELGEAGSKEIDETACAVELIHCYSLIHDDLPSMDDDDLRRGKATCHIAFDEATAILAGDALQPLAYSVITNSKSIGLSLKINILEKLTYACGLNGMVEGQMKDIMLKEKISISQLDQIHKQKTGQLIKASLEIGGIIAGLEKEKIRSLSKYGEKIGLAFQIRDDIIDIESPTSISGKKQGSDINKNKSTYPEIVGLDESKRKAKELIVEAKKNLEIFSNKAERLRDLATFIIERNH